MGTYGWIAGGNSEKLSGKQTLNNTEVTACAGDLGYQNPDFRSNE